MKLKVETSSEEYASAEEMIIDEAGIELFIDGHIELGGSFENLDNFQLAYAVLPEDFDTTGHEEYAGYEVEIANTCSEWELETTIWIFSQELAKRRGYAKK